MSRNRHIDTRNLVVCSTFDEFAQKVGQLDSNVEDIVGYVTSVSRVFYWLNVESVWGVLGFTWEPNSLETLEGVPYIEERLEHVEANGAIIDYSQKDAAWKLAHAVKKGYGHFNATTLPFTIIPKLPDGYRITEFRNTFNLIESDYIEVQLSDWSNLVDINYLARTGQSIKIDLTGADNLNSNSKTILNNSRIGGVNNNWTATVYIKGDLHNCTSGNLSYNSYNNWTNHHTILVDDNNKGLNIPLSLHYNNQFYYTDSEKVFDVRDWLLLNTPSSGNGSNNGIRLLAKSKKYYINNAFAKSLQNVGSYLRMSANDTRLYDFDTFVEFKEIYNPVNQNIEPCTITIDCTEDTDVREDLIFCSDVGTNYGNSVYEYQLHVYNPIQYIGTPTSITMWNPYCLVKDDNSWPEYDQSLIDKLTPIDGSTWKKGYFMYGAYIYLSKPSPYTIDCTNLTCLSLFMRAKFFVSDYSSFRNIGGSDYAIEIVKLTNVDLECIHFGSEEQDDGGGGYVPPFYYTLPTLKTKRFGAIRRPKFFIPTDSIITFQAWYGFGYYNFKVEDFTKKHFKFEYIDMRDYGSDYSIMFKPGYGIDEIGTSSGPIDLYDFAPEILADTDFLKAAKIDTLYSCRGSREVVHPIICVNPYSYFTYRNTSINISSNFVFIYKSDIVFTNYHNWQDITNPLTQFVTKIYPGIQANDTDTTYHITFTQNIYNALQTQYPDVYEDLITNLNYQVSADSE